jgi:hypothetical protein
VPTVTPERSLSAVRLLKTDLRNGSSVNCFNGLAISNFNFASAAAVHDVINHSQQHGYYETRISIFFKAESADLILTLSQTSLLASTVQNVC